MPRLPRICPLGIPQHIIQRGNNRQVCFGSEEDMSAYMHWLETYADKFGVLVHAWVLMTNHVHLLVTPQASNAVSLMMQALGRRYVQYFNRTYRRSGTLWEGRFRSCIVQSSYYLLFCQRYIELNPVRAGMVNDPAEYTWSSYQAHGLGKVIRLHSPHSEYLQLDQQPAHRQAAYRDLFRYQMDADLVDDLRRAVNKGMALGNNRFLTELEALHQRQMRPATMGRPKKTKK